MFIIDENTTTDEMIDAITPEVARRLWANCQKGDEGIESVGKYDLVDLLGEGGGGSVWSALPQDAAELVALKIIPAKSKVARTRAWGEIYRLQSLQSAFTPRVFDVGRDEELQAEQDRATANRRPQIVYLVHREGLGPVFESMVVRPLGQLRLTRKLTARRMLAAYLPWVVVEPSDNRAVPAMAVMAVGY